MDWIARVALISTAVLATLQYGFSANWAWLRIAYFVTAAALAVWTLWNSRGKQTGQAMLEATLPFITSLICLYSQMQLPLK